ncbi:MAG: hypothetical protein WAU82_16220 [Candidatus Binatus sp.]|uniref:hypothetical protein n=1 Tax=Candidatus Binatus sp. TaxID=2811406 RepID=UPI003BB127D0
MAAVSEGVFSQPRPGKLDVLQESRRPGKKNNVHEHVSEPADLATGKGDFNGELNSPTIN